MLLASRPNRGRVALEFRDDDRTMRYRGTVPFRPRHKHRREPMKLVSTLSLAICAVLVACSIVSAQADADVMSEAKRQYRNGNYQAALTELTRVTDEAPDRADAFYLMGYAHLMLRQYPESVDAFARAFQLDPTLDPRSIYQQRSTQ